MTFYPAISAAPGAYWGWDAIEGPCSEAVLDPLLLTPGGGAAMRLVSFQDTPYGFAFDFDTTPSLTPYEIDAATLRIALGTPVSGPYSGSASDIQSALVLDDSTMVFAHLSGATGTLHAISRSGLSISVSGAQQSVSSLDTQSVCRIDATHFVRAYRVTGTFAITVQVFSVSGTTISLVHSDTFSASWNATVDPSGLPSPMGQEFFPFHYDGSGTLYSYGTGTPASPTLPHVAILATPFSIGGGIGTIGLSTRAKDAQNISRLTNPPSSKIGSTECALQSVTGLRIGFWDDGTNMHYDATGVSVDWIGATFINHLDESADTATTQGNYLTEEVVQLPQGTMINAGPALVTQSGQTFGYSLITPRFLCPQFGTDLDVGSGSARHGSNLGAMLIANPFVGDGRYLIRAYSW